MTTLWDTTGTAVVHALAAERRQAGSVSAGLALTLVVVVDESRVSEAEQAATRAAAEHPCRMLVVVRRRPDAPEPRLDAEVLIGGRLGPGEAVVMRMYGRLALHAESVVLPLLAPDAPVVTWWYGEPPNRIAHDPLGVSADRRITDCTLATDPMAALQQRAHDYAPRDTDLCWTRTTRWRALCASVVDAAGGSTPRELRVVGARANPTRALLVGWLQSRLGQPVEVLDNDERGIVEVSMALGEVTATLRREGPVVVLSRTDQPDRRLPFERRDLGDLLAEELRRLDADEVYADALGAATGVADLASRSARRTHVWHDPMAPGTSDADSALASP